MMSFSGGVVGHTPDDKQHIASADGPEKAIINRLLKLVPS